MVNEHSQSETDSKIMVKLEEIHKDVLKIKNQRNQIDDDYLLDVNEVCALLHLSDRQIRRYQQNEQLKGFQIGSRRVYWYSAVKEFVKDQERDYLHRKK